MANPLVISEYGEKLGGVASNVSNTGVHPAGSWVTGVAQKNTSIINAWGFFDFMLDAGFHGLEVHATGIADRSACSVQLSSWSALADDFRTLMVSALCSESLQGLLACENCSLG